MMNEDFLIMNSDGIEIDADAFGDHVAFSCDMCGYPVLASVLTNQRGSDEKHPSRCRGCGRSYFIDLRAHAKKAYIHELS